MDSARFEWSGELGRALFENVPEQILILDGFEGPLLAANSVALKAHGVAQLDQIDVNKVLAPIWYTVDPLTQRTVIDVVAETGIWQGDAPSMGPEGAAQLDRITVVSVNDPTRTLNVIYIRTTHSEALFEGLSEAVDQGLESSLVSRALELQQRCLEETAKATQDALTGLKNRRAFEVELEERLASGAVALLLFDLDHFKSVNDTYGHPVGDAVLRTMAGVLQKGLRSVDSAYRLGGEEFGVLLPLARPRIAADVAERLRRMISEAETDGLKVTASVGVALASDSSATVDSLYHEADRALYRAKKNGRNQVVLGVSAERDSA
ncbi:MAG: GGDEF domain-containing protein [Fimbriimonadaceae bacterium]|nr:GGDEF domain-containing protein [Fimbriimonadaceae bacterium]